MTFLNPLVLLALAAASIPLLLHLFNLRKLGVVEFSSVRFLKELQKTKIRRVKLTQILLLLLRIGVVVFAVLAFARPALRGSAGLPGTHAATTAVILIDDSFSMALADERGPRLQQAQDAAVEVIDLLEENDEAYVLPMSSPERAGEAVPSRSVEALHARVRELKLGYRRADVENALRAAASLLDRSENINKELYIITDAQRSNLQATADSLRLFDADTRIYLLPIGGDDVVAANLGLDSIRVLSAVFERDRPVEVRAWIHNYTDREISQAVVSLYFNGQRMAQQTVTVRPGATETIDIAAAPRAARLVSGYVEVTGDRFAPDNRRYFALRVPDQMRVAVFGSPEVTRFLELAMRLPSAGTVATRFDAVQIQAVDLSSYSSVVVADAGALNAASAGTLARYLERGGGLVLYAGATMDRSAFNTTAGVALGVGLGSPTGNSEDRSRALRFGSVEREHPIFLDVFDPARPGSTVESPEIYRVLPASGGESIVRLTNGLPAVSEFRLGSGRIVYVGVPPTAVWSTLPTTGIFVPLAVRSALYVGATGEAFVQATAGEAVTVPIPGRTDLPAQVRVVPPSGRDRFVPVRRLPSGASIGYDATGEPGVYRVRSGEEDLALFAVNMGSGESDLTPVETGRLVAAVARRSLNPANITVLQERRGDFEASITEARVGLELWKYMLVLALLCAFAEMIVGRAPKKRMDGGE